uniref:Uncharacterized protein n=1 Tax=Oryza brachyantha TaxID=4533 RepID=J3N7U1_ORYBR
MGNGETCNLACPYSTYQGKGKRDGVWTGNHGVTKASTTSGFTKAQVGTARLGVKEGVKPEVRCVASLQRTSAFAAAVVSNFGRSSVKSEESSSATGEESDIGNFKRRSQDEDGVDQESSFVSSAVAAAFEP